MGNGKMRENKREKQKKKSKRERQESRTGDGRKGMKNGRWEEYETVR
jgi:hypothetical protein